MVKSVYFIAILLCLNFLGFGQKSMLSGRVLDSMNQAMVAATVVLLDPIDTSLVSFGITNEKGQFFLPSINSGIYKLQITYIGYGSFQQDVILPAQKELGDILLIRENTLIEEIVVKAEHVPVSIYNDTVMYNALAYKVRSSDAVEDLLKKLPGIEISPTGEIKAHGEAVKKVLVDGKEFFGNDFKVATKNLPADIVDKVAVFDKKTDESKFTGIDDGQQSKTIDLRLKADKKIGVFGKLGAGAGSDQRFTGKAQVNSFNSKMQASFIGNANNVNEIAFDGNLHANEGNGIVVINQGAEEKPAVNGNNQTLSSGFNFNYDFDKNARLRSSYFLKSLHNKIFEKSLSNYLTPGNEFINNEELNSNLKNFGHNINVNFELDRDTSFQLRMSNLVSFAGQNNLFSGIAFNQSQLGKVISTANRNNANNGNNLDYNLDLALRKRLQKKGRLLGSSFNVNTSNEKNNDQLGSSFSSDDISQYVDQNQANANKSLLLTASLSYTEPLIRGYLMTGFVRASYDNQQTAKDFYNVTGNQDVFLAQLSGENTRNIKGMRYGFNLVKQNKQFGLAMGAGIQTNKLEFLGLENNGSTTKNIYILPNFNFIKFKEHGSLNLRYSTQLVQPTIQQMSTLLVNLNPQFLFLGNSKLKPQYDHNFNFFYHHYDPFYLRNQSFFVRSTYSKAYLSNSRQTDDRLVTTIKPVNVGYQFTSSTGYSYGAPFVIPKTKVNLDLDLQYYNGEVVINKNTLLNSRFVEGGSFTIENKNKKTLDLSLKYDFENTKSSYKDQGNLSITYQTHTLTAFGEWNVTDHIAVGSDLTKKRYSDERISTTANLNFWNIFAHVDLGKSSRWSVALALKDIFNQGKAISRNVSSLAIIETSSSNIGCYGLLTLTYSLSDFKPSKNIF